MDILLAREVAQIFLMVVYTNVQSRMLPMPERRRVLYIAFMALVYIAIVIAGLRAIDVWRVIELATLYVVAPIPFYDAPARLRVLAATLSFSILMCGEMLSTFVSVALFGAAVGDISGLVSDPLPYFACLVIDTLFIHVVGGYLSRLMRRVSSTEGLASVARFMWMVPFQAIPSGILMTLGFTLLPASKLYFFLLGIAGVAILGVCVLELRMLERAVDAIRERERARALEQQLDGYLARYDEVLEGMRRIKRLRHDARNHAAVVRSLVERGEMERAHAYARACVEMLEGGGYDARPVPHEDGEATS